MDGEWGKRDEKKTWLRLSSRTRERCKQTKAKKGWGYRANERTREASSDSSRFLRGKQRFSDDLPWLSVYTSGKIASSTKTSTNLHCTVASLTVHCEFEHQISLNMFLGQRIAMREIHANVMTTGNHVFAFGALSSFTTRTPHRTDQPTRLLRRFGLLRHLCPNRHPHLFPLSSHPIRRTHANLRELTRPPSAPIPPAFESSVPFPSLFLLSSLPL